MKKLVVHGATLRCSQGTAPSSLAVLPTRATENEAMRVATVADHAPMTNVMPFGMCRTLANPQVASATSAAQGVLTPQPCIPVTAAPWTPGASVTTIDGVGALTADSTCSCNWTGMVSVEDPASAVEVE